MKVIFSKFSIFSLANPNNIVVPIIRKLIMIIIFQIKSHQLKFTSHICPADTNIK